jgi:hypothetical protein
MTPKASFKNIVTLLTSLGTNHTDINDVFRWNRLELAGALRRGADKTIMLIDAVEIDSDSPANNSVHHNKCSFFILGKQGVKTDKVDSYAAQNEVLEHCLLTAFECAARLVLEANDPANKWLYGNIEKGSFTYTKVGPLFTNNLFGYRCQFTIKSMEKYQVDSAKWTDLV